MAITASNLTVSYDVDGNASSTTASVSPASKKLQLLTVLSRTGISANPNQPTVTGNGLTWVAITSTVYDDSSSSRRRITLFRAMGASPSAGTITIDFGGQNQTTVAWALDEFSGVDTSGTNGSGAIVQSASNNNIAAGIGTSLTVTLSAFSSTGNATFGAFGSAANSTSTVGSGFTQLADATTSDSNLEITTEWKSTNDTSVDMTWGASNELGGIAVEIKPTGTFGYTTLGGSVLGPSQDKMYGTKFTSPLDIGQITDVRHAICSDLGTGKYFKVAIVLASTGAIVTNGISNAAEMPYDAGQNPSWVTLTFSTPPTLTPSTDYILYVIHGDSAWSNYSAYDAGTSGNYYFDGSNSYSSPTNPTDAVNTGDDNGGGSDSKLSIYVTYTPSSGTNIEVTPTATSGAFTQVAPSISGAAGVSPTSVSSAFTIVAPTVSAIQNVSVTPSAVTGSFTQVAPTIDAAINIEVTPAALTSSFNQVAPTISTTENVEVTPSAVTGSFTQVAPTISTVQNVDVVPTAISSVLTIVDPSISLQTDEEVTPSAVVGSFTIPDPDVVASQNIEVTPSALTAAFTIVDPEVLSIQEIMSDYFGLTFVLQDPVVSVEQNWFSVEGPGTAWTGERVVTTSWEEDPTVATNWKQI